MALSLEELEKRVIAMANLPTLPGILRKITLMTEGRDSTAADVATLIATDQVLSAKVLRLVNSPIYGFPGRISSITHAVVLLGFNVIKGLVLGTAVFDALGDTGQELWNHSLGCAVISRRLAIEAGMEDAEEIMIAGLLHDLGKVALAYVAPGHYAQTVQVAKKSRLYIGDAEREMFGVSHPRVGNWLADEWHFPARLAEPLLYHHDPSRAKVSVEATDVIHLADVLARGMGYGDPGDDVMPLVSQESFGRLGLTLEQIDHALKEAEMEYQMGAQTLEGDTP